MQGSATDRTSADWAAAQARDAVGAFLTEAAGAREPVKPVIEITAKVARNSILIAGVACPQERSKQSQVGKTQVARRASFALFLRRVKFVP